MKQNGITATGLGKIMVVDLKWQPSPKTVSDFTLVQYREILPHLKRLHEIPRGA